MTEQELLDRIVRLKLENIRLKDALAYERRCKEDRRRIYEILLSDYYDLEEDYEDALDRLYERW